MKSFNLEGPNSKPIALDLFQAKNHAPLAIFVHGFKGFKDWGTHHLCARFFNRQGLSFLRFNFSHNGISIREKEVFDDLEAFAENTFSKELSDLDEVITFALSGGEFPAPEKLYLIGHSRGGGISVIQAAEDPRINKLVTWSSVSRFNNMWKPEQESEWRKNGVIFTTNARTKQQMPLNLSLLEDLEHNSERLDITNAAKSVTQPWLIIHGDKDAAVPLEQAFELQRQNHKSMINVIAGGDHVFDGRHPWPNNELPEKLREVCQITFNFLTAD